MPFALAPILAFDKGLIGQLVFVLIALLAWILREAAERKAAQRSENATSEDEVEKPSAIERLAALLDPDESDERERQARIDARVAERARRRRAEHPEEYVEVPATEPAPPELPEAPSGRPKASESPLTTLDSGFESAQVVGLASTSDTPSAPTPTRRPRARERLGITPGGARAATRRAILWAEVLGPPRAHAGPHRPPMARRFSGRL